MVGPSLEFFLTKPLVVYSAATFLKHKAHPPEHALEEVTHHFPLGALSPCFRHVGPKVIQGDGVAGLLLSCRAKPTSSRWDYGRGSSVANHASRARCTLTPSRPVASN